MIDAPPAGLAIWQVVDPAVGENVFCYYKLPRGWVVSPPRGPLIIQLALGIATDCARFTCKRFRAGSLQSWGCWWWRGGDLNSRPIDYESIALTN